MSRTGTMLHLPRDWDHSFVANLVVRNHPSRCQRVLMQQPAETITTVHTGGRA